jgi:hypothetical protein
MKIMRAKVGITQQAFLTMGTYLCIILFHSSSLSSALAAAVSVLLVQTAAFIILPVLYRRFAGINLTYAAVSLTVFAAVIIYRLYGLVPFDGIMQPSVLFPDFIYLLILVPLLVDQAHSSGRYRTRITLIQAAMFIGMMLTVSVCREILGFGTFLGVRVFPEGTQPLPLLTHASGAAFLILILTLLALYLFRRISGRSKVLAVLDESLPSAGQPVLNRKRDLGNLYAALISLLVVSIVMLSLYFLALPAMPFKIPFDLILILAVVLQGVVLLILYWVTGRSNEYISEILHLSWLIPLQTYVLVLPFSSSTRSLLYDRGVPGGLFALFIYVVCSWIFGALLLLFVRSVKRRLLFGNRPEILSGLPLFLLFMGLGLMIAAGFASITDVLTAH